jgi:hypothetical protein
MDYYDSEFRYDKEPVGALQGLAPDRVFLVGTVSKALAPAVRLGWVLAPAGLADAVAAEKEMSDRGSCTLDQVALAGKVAFSLSAADSPPLVRTRWDTSPQPGPPARPATPARRLLG